MTSYDALRAESERTRRDALGLRVLVQDSHTTRAVGSRAVADVLVEALAGKAKVVAVGSDGASFLAPRVTVVRSSGEAVTIDNVTLDGARAIAADPRGASGGEPQAGPFWASQHRVVLEGCGETDPVSIDEYAANGGYAGLARALEMGPERVIAEVLKADLRGRGGAYFPAARKWEGARKAGPEPRYVVVNAEEGEPGIYKDRHIMEGVPHRLIEGVIIAGYAAGAAKGYIYVNAEANLSAKRVQTAVEQARERGVIGESVLDSGFAFEVEVRRGAGGYVCGEETTLLSTIEGYRRVPRLRPPFPTEAGLWARPTVINNVETLCNVPFILTEGAEAFAAIGHGSVGTKLVSLSGAVQRPGLIEIPMGTTYREIVYEIGGGPPSGRRLVAVAAGGPSGGLLPESMLDTGIAPGLLHESGAVLGSGGVVVIDQTMPVPQVVRALARYNADESCGKCTPCREGTPRLVEVLDRLIAGRGKATDLDELRYLTEIVASASLCGLGQMAGGPITSGLHFFGDEFADLAGVR